MTTGTNAAPGGAPDPALIAQATSLHQQGQIGQAIERYRALLAAYPELHAIWMLLGMAELQSGRMNEATSALETSLRIQPANPLAWVSLGNAVQASGHHARAIESFDRALAMAPDHVDALFNRGVSLDALGRLNDALDAFVAVLSRQPAHPGALNNAGEALRKLGRLDEALNVFGAAIATHPQRPELRLNRGVTALESGDPALALADFDALLTLAPDHPIGLNNRGNALHGLGRHREALDMFDRAVKAAPGDAQAWLNRANVLQALERYDDADACYVQARTLVPDSAMILWNASQLSLLRGRFTSGWEEFEARWQLDQTFDPQRHTSLPRWLGESDPTGKRIVLWHEQGLGDTLQFCRFAPVLAAQGAQVVLEVQPALKALVRESMPGVEVIATGEPVGQCDAAIPLMSLPYALRALAARELAEREVAGREVAKHEVAVREVADCGVAESDVSGFAGRNGYLRADPDKVSAWAARLGPRRGVLRVGLVFSGNPLHRNDANRSIAASAMQGLLASTRPIEWVVLQKDLRAADAAWLASHPHVRAAGTELDSFADTAALIECLDLVISVDTSVAHLAGALGKPVWILLPSLPDWRWLLERHDSPWYASARLFRRPAGGDWASVLTTVERNIDALR